MKKTAFTWIAFMIVALTSSAQNTVESIRKEYSEVQQRISRMGDAAPEEYYNLHVKQMLPATGSHDVNIYMYYDELPGQEEDVIYPEQYLQFATKKYNFAAREYYEEYLFDAKGQAMFIYSRYTSDDMDNVYELRMWFDGKRMLRLMAKESTSDDWANPVFKDVYTGTDIPGKFKDKCEELKSSAGGMLGMFKNINYYPF